MIDLANNLWAITIGGTLIASVAAGYLVNSWSKNKEEQEREAHLRSRLKYARELREGGAPSDALRICIDLLKEVSELKHPGLWAETKALVSEIRMTTPPQPQASVSPAQSSAAFPQTSAPQVAPAAQVPAIPVPSVSVKQQPEPLPLELLRKELAQIKEQMKFVSINPTARVSLTGETLAEEFAGTLYATRKTRKWLRKHRKKSAVSLSLIFAFALASMYFSGAEPADMLWVTLSFAFVLSLIWINRREEKESQPLPLEPVLQADAPVFSETSHSLFLQIKELLASLDQEIKQIPKDLVEPFRGIQGDLKILSEKANNLNEVWKSVLRLISQTFTIPGSAASASVQEQEAKTRKVLEDLKAHIDASMAETLSMLRALLTQVMQLKTTPRLTAPDPFSQIHENLRERLTRLEAVEETFHPFEPRREKA